MKIGILNVDKLTNSLIKKYGCYADAFVKLLSNPNNKLAQTNSFKTYNVIDMEFPDSIDACDAYIITGSQYSTYENLNWIKELEIFIQKLHSNKKKLIGICFGHQIIAQSLGGHVEKNIKGWEIGMTTTHITQSQAWMEPAREFFFMLVSHQDQITVLPDNATNFCKTNFCPYSGFYIDNHILTFQGHPEFQTDYVKLIIKLQSKNLTDEQRKSARASLKQNDDHELVADWILRFLIH